MADSKKLAEVTVLIGAEADLKSVDKAVKKATDKIATQALKIPVSVIPDFSNLSRSGPKSSGAVPNLQGKVQKQTENVAKELAANVSALVNQASILERNAKIAKQLAARREKAEINLAVAKELEAQEAIKAAEASKRIASITPNFSNLRRGTVTPTFNRQSQTQNTNIQSPIDPIDKLLGGITGKDIPKLVTQVESFLRTQTKHQAKITDEQETLAEAYHKQAIAAGKKAIQDAKDILKRNKNLSGAGLPSDKAASEAARAALEEAKITQGFVAARAARLAAEEARLSEEEKNNKAAKAARMSLQNAQINLKKSQDKQASDALKAGEKLENSILRTEEAAAQKKILDAGKQLLGSQLERINEVRKAAALQRLSNKQLEKQGQGKIAKPSIDVQKSSINLSAGIKAAQDGISSLAASFLKSAKDAAKFSLEVTEAASQQRRLKEALGQQVARFTQAQQIIPKVNKILTETLSELTKQKQVVTQTTKDFSDNNKEFINNKRTIRDINTRLTNVAVTANAFSQEINDRYGSLKRAGDLAEFKFSRGDIDGFSKISKLITAQSKEQEKFNNLLRQRSSYEARNTELSKIGAKLLQEQANAVGRVRDLEAKKIRLEQEGEGLLSKLNGIHASRIRIQTELARAESRGLINRAINFVTGRGGNTGGNGNGGNGAPPGGPPPPNGGNRDDFKKGTGGVNAFNSALKTSYSLLERVRAGLNSSDRAAIDFGKSIRITTERLLAFAAPATVIYKLSTAIKTATDDIVKLDTQVRRLSFFESAGQQGGIGKFASDIQDVGKKTTLLGNTFNNLANEARRTGVSIETVVSAAQTVSRIGEISFLPDGSSSDFLKATLGLTQIEAGAISADRAAEILKATMSQFGLSAEQAIPIAAKFNAVALETSSSVEELATLTTRFGSAAINIQNLTLDQTLALASVTAKTLGTNTFRAATALRQLTTRIVQNAQEVKELTGVEVVSENGQLVGIESVLKSLEKLNELGNNSAGNVLARLLGEGENIADTFAIARAVGQIREEFAELENTATGTQKVKDQVASFLAVIGLQSQGAESALNNLSTSFKELVQSAGTVNIITGLANSFTTLIDGATAFSKAIGGITGAFSSLAPALGTVFGGLIKKSLLATFGFLSGSAAKEAFRSNVEDLLNTPVKRTKQIELLTKDGLLTVQQGNNFLERSNNLLVAQEKIEKQIRISKILIGVEEKKSVTNLDKIKSLDEQILRLEKAKEVVLKNQQNASNKLVQTNLTGLALLKKDLKENTGAALSAGLSTAAIAFGTFLPKIIGSGTNQQAMTDAIVGTFTGGALGAQIGGIFGPHGAIGGAIVGGLLANFSTVVEKLSNSDFVQALQAAIAEGRPGAKTANDSDREIKAEAKKRFLLEQQNKAAIAYSQAIEAQARKQIDSVVQIVKAQEALGRIKTINDEIVAIEESIFIDRQNGIGVTEKLNRLKDLATKRAVEEKQASKDIEANRARELKLQQQIASIQTGTEVGASVDKIKTDINSFLGKLQGKNTLKLEIEFDRRQIQDKINSISNTRSILLKAEAEETNPEKREKIQQDLIKNSEQLIKETTSAYDNIFAGQRKVIEEQKASAKEVLALYEQAAASLLNAQQNVFSQNKKIASSVLERTNLSDRRAENRNTPTNDNSFTSSQRDIREASESLRRTQNVRDSSLTSNRLFVKDLSGQFKEAGKRLKELDSIYKLNQDSLTSEIQSRKALLEAAQNNFEQQIGFERDNLEFRKESTERLISKQQELISAEIKMIEVIKERAKQEAEFGRNLLESPEEAFKNLKNLDLAQQFLNIDKELNSRGTRQRFDADKSGSLSAQEREVARNSILEDRLNKLLAQSGGRGITQQILDGLKFAGGLANDPFTSVGGSLANEELLARLIGGGSVPTKPGETSQLDRQEGTIENRRKQLDETFKTMDAIINQQLELERKVQSVEKERLSLISSQVEQLKGVKLPESLNAIDTAVLRFTKTVETIVPLLDKFRALAETNPTGPNFEKVVEELRIVSESFSAAAGKENLKTEDLVNSLGSTFDSSIERLNGVLSNLQVQFEADVAPIEVKLNAEIIASLNGEDLARQLRDTLIGTGLEDRVSEIQGIITRLVEIEKARGGKFPPTPPR